MTERLLFHFSLSCTGEGNGNQLQRSCLENPRDGGAWWAAVYGIAQSRTQLKRLSSSTVQFLGWEAPQQAWRPEEGKGYPFLYSSLENTMVYIVHGVTKSRTRLIDFHFNKGILWTIMEKAMAIHSSTLAWKLPWMEEPDRLQSMGSKRVGHD